MIIMRGTDMETELYRYRLTDIVRVTKSSKLPDKLINEEFYVSSNINEGQCVTWIYDNRSSYRTSIVNKIVESKRNRTITLYTDDLVYTLRKLTESKRGPKR